MNEGIDERLLFLTARLADGQAIDWEFAREELPEDLVTRLVSLDRLFRVMRSGTSGSPAADMEQWGHLRVGAPLAEGGYGLVVRAFDPILQREVALKLRRPDAMDEVTAWIHEARRLARVRHPNVLAVHGADIHNNVPGLWSDLVVGQTLAERLRDGPLDKSELLSLAAKLSAAVAAVHAEGIVHGDIKPSNIMIQPDGTPILMDFGAAREGSTVAATVGSPLFMAPEQFSGAPVSRAADIYAFGVLLYRMLVGRHPVEAESLNALAESHERGAQPDCRRLPRGYRALVSSCLARDPEERPDAASVHERLRTLERAPAVRRRRIAICGIFASLLVGLIAAGAGLMRALESEREARLERNKAAGTLAFVENMLEAPSMLNKGPELKVVDLLDAAARELEMLPPDARLEAAPVHLILGNTYRSLDQYKAAQRQLTRALELLDAQPAVNEAELLDIRTELAVIAFFLDDAVGADALFEAVRGDAEALGGRRSLPYLKATFKQGEIAIGRGDYAAAIELLEHANAHSATLPEDEELPPKIQTKLAQLYAVSGRLEEAEHLARKALEWEFVHRGEATIPGVILRNSLAIVLNHKGDFGRAETQLRQGLSALDRVAPGPSRIRSGLQANLANALHGQGRVEEAIEVNKAILEAAHSRAEPNWRRIIDVTGNIGGSYLESGDYDQARTWLREATRLAREKTGPESTAFLYPAMNLCSLYLETGAIEQAVSYCGDISETAGQALGPDHLLTLQTASFLGAVLVRAGQAEKGLSVLQRTAGSMREHLGQTNPITLRNDAFVVEALLAAGHPQEAKASAISLLAARREALPAGHPDIGKAKRLLQQVRDNSSDAGEEWE